LPLGGLLNTFQENQLVSELAQISPLGCAVLAWYSRRNTKFDFMKGLSHYGAMTVAELNTAISFDCGVDEKEVFASNLIGWVAYSSCSDEIQAHAHLHGSMAILDNLVERASRRLAPVALTENLKIFGPFIFDCANAWSIRNGVVPNRQTNFHQRTEYFDHLRSTNDSGVWYSGILEAANSTLGNVLEVALIGACQTATESHDSDSTRVSTDDVLFYLRAELGDHDLHAALQVLNQSFQGRNTNHATVEGQLITRIFHRLRCILLLHTLLEAPSLQEGLSSEKAIYICKKIISFCRAQTIRGDRSVDDYFMLSWHNFSHLLLGGMGLHPVESSDRTSHCKCD
jgi:hypothetical protein